MRELRSALTGPLAFLANYRQFITYRLDPVPGRTKLDKVPVHPGTLHNHDPHDPTIWSDWQTACDRAEALGETYGVAFVITAADPIWCIDLDYCLGPDGWMPVVLDMFARFPGIAHELSVSGEGLHLWGAAPGIPQHRTKALGIELYSSKRFIALTGRGAQGGIYDYSAAIATLIAERLPPRAAGAPEDGSGPVPEWDGPTDDGELIRKALASKSASSAFGQRASFSSLWHADLQTLGKAFPSGDDRPFDASSADAALMAHLSFWTGKDADRMIRLARMSGLAQLDAAGKRKYEREDYLQRTADSVTGSGAVYQRPKRVEPVVVHAEPAAPAVGVTVQRSHQSDDVLQGYREAFLQCGTIGEIEAVCDCVKADERVSALVREAMRTLVREAGKRVGAEISLARAMSIMTPDRVAMILPGDYERDSNGNIILSQGNIAIGCRRGDFRYDEFTGHIITEGRRLEDEDYTRTIIHLERITGFPPMPQKGAVKDAIRLVAIERSYDAAQEWLEILPPWDGVNRVETLLIRAFHLQDTPYHRAVSRYMWTALAGRTITPGVKADMVPVLMSEREGMLKSTFVEALVPDPALFGKLNLGHKDDDISRSILGRLVIEWGELRGLKGRDHETIIETLSRTREDWTPKYVENQKQYLRRCIIFGTSNDMVPLPTYSDGRRFLPVAIHHRCDVDVVRAERDQLWAEAAALYRANGVEFHAAEVLAIDERDEFRPEDPMEQYIYDFLQTTPRVAFGETAGGNYAQVGFRIYTLKHHLQEHTRGGKIISDVAISKILKKIGLRLHRTELCNLWKL